MDRLRELVGRLWLRFRGWPLWAQIVTGLVIVSVIVGPFIDASEDDGEQATPTTEEVTTTTVGPEGETTTTDEPVTTTALEATTTTQPVSPCADEEVVRSGNQGSGLVICQEDYGDEWPFTLPTGLLSCRPAPSGQPAILFESRAVNGIAQSHAGEFGWGPVDEIWLDNPAIPGTKVDLGPIIQLALDELCPEG